MAGRSGQQGLKFSDLRLVLDSVEDRIVATLIRVTDGQILGEHRSEVPVDAVRALARDTCGGVPSPANRVQWLAQNLGRAGFGGRVSEALASEIARHPIRIQLRADRNLSPLPWELALVRDLGIPNDGYIALASRVSLTRDVGNAPKANLGPRDQPRVLVAWANPGSSTYPLLHFAEKEASSVVRALRSAECSSVQVDELPFATVSSLLKSVADRKPNVIHFIGHGDLTPSGGVIVLEGGMPGAAQVLYVDQLAKVLVDAEVSLVVLSGCLTAGSPEAIGSQLALAGIPAVIAMSMPIQDAAAHQFARALYSSLAEGTQLEEALLEGRLAIRGMGCDWAAPQLMLSGSEAIVLSRPDDSSPQWQTPTRKTNLTIDDRPFIGRTKERADLRRKIRDQGQRLVTITGPGGMGKTRLSKQVAAELLDDFPDGVWLVDCEALVEPQELGSGLASALPFASSGESREGLKESLSRRRTLIVLDCFEHSLSCGPMIEDLLQGAPDVYLLITSRILLGLPREHEYQLPPMGLSGKGREVPDSLTLFAEAAGHALDGFEITAKNRKQLRELCGSLEGVPLALVLAAGRLRHLGLTELIDQVREQPVATLRRRTGGIDRHANIESVVAGSFRLLPPDDRQMLYKVGLFAGSFTIADAISVCNLSQQEVVARLSELRDHSLVQISRGEDSTRYKLLDTVRDYLSRLELDSPLFDALEACRERHAVHYSRMASEIGRLMSEGRWSAGTAILWQEIGNFRAATTFASIQGRSELIANMAEHLARRYFEAGLLSDFRKLADAGYLAAEKLANPIIRIRLLGLDGALSSRQGDEALCERLWTERADLCRQVHHVALCAETLIDLGWQAYELKDTHKCRLRLIEALRLAREAGDISLIATSRIVQGRIAFAMSNPQLARRRAEQAEALLARWADQNSTLFIFQNLSILYAELNEPHRSVEFTVRLLRAGIERHQVIHIGWALLRLPGPAV